MGIVNIVRIMTPEQRQDLKLLLVHVGGMYGQRPSGASFRVKGEEWVVTSYNSGKVLFQGRRSDIPLAIADQMQTSGVSADEKMPLPVVGGDESGKGDLFGPLVVSAFAVRTPEERSAAVAAGARDCKLMSDGEVRTVAARLKTIGMCEIVVLMPAQYNMRYRRAKNVNVLLNELYANLLLGLARKCDARTVILDKYGNRAVSLWKEEQSFRFIVEERAERYLEVAAASVLARNAFLDGLDRLAHENGLETLPKGSSAETQAVLKRLVRQRGESILNYVAKTHFAPVQACLNDLFEHH